MKLNKIGDLIKHPKLGEHEHRVIATAKTGGGTGHGPHDKYPDGHQITLMPEEGGHVDWRSEPKKFFQSGCFDESVMLPYCQPIVEKFATKHKVSLTFKMPSPLCDASKPWGMVEFIHTDGEKHTFKSFVNELTGDRLSWFDKNPPTTNDTVPEVKKIFANIKKKAVRIIKYYGTKDFML